MPTIDTPAATRAAVRALPFTLPSVCPLCRHAIRDDERRGDYRGDPAHRLCALEQDVTDVREELADVRTMLKRAREQIGDALYHAA